MDAQVNTSAPHVGANTMPKWIWIAGGAVALTIAGLATALTQARNANQAAAPAVVEAPAAKTALAEPARTAPAPRAAEPREPAPIAICSTCGTVESVQAVKVKGEGTGVGAVAGGVIGGVVGNQMGSGNGRKALTVLGAVGGGFAGHEVEKHVKAKTVYSVKVRMDDGTLRTVQQSQAPAVGAKVKVDGTQLRPA
jgi:outer membrane lipoprotein SlyB